MIRARDRVCVLSLLCWCVLRCVLQLRTHKCFVWTVYATPNTCNQQLSIALGSLSSNPADLW